MRRPVIRPYRSPLRSGYDDLDDLVSVDECAARMGITADRVVALVKRGALRHSGGLVEPALFV
jgi:hypothetical protein